MKAIVYHKYGSPEVLTFEEVDKPIPKENEVLLKVKASSINAGDWHLMRGEPFLIRMFSGFRKPKFKILGTDVSGEIESVGKNVQEFKAGDEVFGDISSCGFGAFAEYVSVPEDLLLLKPSDKTFQEVAALPSAGVTALQGLRDKGKIKQGQKVLIHGASGGVGSFAVQIAKSFGAEVTGVCSGKKMEMVKSIGADFVIDYAKDDFVKNGQQYDLILGVAGNRSIFDYKRALSSNGIYIQVGGSMKQMFQAMFLGPWISMFGKRKMSNMLVKPNLDDLLFLKELLASNEVIPAIDREFPLNDVADAIRYFETGNVQGKIVLSKSV
jgi:NADPH:quinone reductase-like Zn-dependent oxidoreductase